MKKGKITNNAFVIYTIVSLIIFIVTIPIIVIPSLSTQIVENIHTFLEQICFNKIIIMVAKSFSIILTVLLLLKIGDIVATCGFPINIIPKLHLFNRMVKAKSDYKLDVSHNLLMIFHYQLAKKVKKPVYSGPIQDHLAYILASSHGCTDSLLSSVKSICADMKLDTVQSCEDTMVEYKLQEIQRPICFAQVIVVIFDKNDTELYYKLGIAHALDKPTILLIDSNDMPQIPKMGRNVIYYSDLCDLKIKLSKNLEELLGSV